MRKKTDTQPSAPPNGTLMTAIFLFREYGYDGIEIDEIAENCGLSDAKLRSVYKTKEEILSALFIGDFDRAYEAAQTVIARPHTTAIEALNDFTVSVAKQHFEFIPKSLWRTAFSNEMKKPGAHFGWHFGVCLTTMRTKFNALFDQLLEEDLLAANADTALLADIFHSHFSMSFIGYIRSDDTPFENFETRLKTINAFILPVP